MKRNGQFNSPIFLNEGLASILTVLPGGKAVEVGADKARTDSRAYRCWRV